MANSPQARKRARQAEGRRRQNASQRSMVRTYIKRVDAAIASLATTGWDASERLRREGLLRVRAGDRAGGIERLSQATGESARARRDLARALEHDGSERALEAWQAAGAVDAAGRANKLWKQLVREYEAPPIDSNVEQALEEYVARRERELEGVDLYY